MWGYVASFFGICALTLLIIVWLDRRDKKIHGKATNYMMPGEDPKDCVYEIRATYYLHEFDEEGLDVRLAVTPAGLAKLYEMREAKKKNK